MSSELEMPRAEWAIDSVLVGVNETSPAGFEDSFSGSLFLKLNLRLSF